MAGNWQLLTNRYFEKEGRKKKDSNKLLSDDDDEDSEGSDHNGDDKGAYNTGGFSSVGRSHRGSSSILLGTNNYMRRAETRTQLLQMNQNTSSPVLKRPTLHTDTSSKKFKKSDGKRITFGKDDYNVQANSTNINNSDSDENIDNAFQNTQINWPQSQFNSGHSQSIH